MARIRSIKPEFWTDPDVTSWPMEDRLFFIGTWNHCDDFGVLKDEPARLKMQILPADDVDPEAIVARIVASGQLLRRATPDGTKVLVIRTFCQNQKLDRRAVGRWGHPDDFHQTPTDPVDSLPLPPDSLSGTDRNGQDRNGTDGTSSSSQATDNVEDPAVGFDLFWDAYPRRNGKRVGKQNALAVWKRLSPPDKRLAFHAAEHYATAVDQGLTIARDPERFLRGDWWREFIEPATPDPDRSSKTARNASAAASVAAALAPHPPHLRELGA